jgi:uncharacterized DUF497 family protein
MLSLLDLDFSWDPVKARSNVTKHKVSFEEAALVLHDRLAITVFDAAHSDTEERWMTVGVSAAGKFLAVSHTFVMTGTQRARVRIISAREGTRNERKQYEKGR